MIHRCWFIDFIWQQAALQSQSLWRHTQKSIKCCLRTCDGIPESWIWFHSIKSKYPKLNPGDSSDSSLECKLTPSFFSGDKSHWFPLLWSTLLLSASSRSTFNWWGFWWKFPKADEESTQDCRSLQSSPWNKEVLCQHEQIRKHRVGESASRSFVEPNWTEGWQIQVDSRRESLVPTWYIYDICNGSLRPKCRCRLPVTNRSFWISFHRFSG